MARPLAEQLRRHREAFLLAQKLGCTPKDAEIELTRRDREARCQERSRRLAAKMHAPLQPGLSQLADRRDDGRDEDGRDPQPWMMRN